MRPPSGIQQQPTVRAAQMAAVFASTTENIRQHLWNIIADGELEESATTKDFLVVRFEGARRVRRRIGHYYLHAITSVGYQVSSKRTVRFRQWATRTLRKHLVSGYTLNHGRPAERGLRETRGSLDLFARTLRNQALVDDTGRAVLELITGYADTWQLLLEYDEDRLMTPPGARPANTALEHPRAVAAIAKFKRDPMASGEASELSENPRSEALEAILGNIQQTMFGEPLCRSREEEAAHVLYFIVKDHPFTDGNNRVGALLFLLYAAQEGIEHGLNPQALTALTLLIAESAPADKDLMVRLIVKFPYGAAGMSAVSESTVEAAAPKNPAGMTGRDFVQTHWQDRF